MCVFKRGSGLYWSYIGIMEKKMETTMSYIGISRIILGLGDLGLGFRGLGLGIRV